MIEASRLAAGHGGTAVWSDASFTVDSGDFVAVLGPNGAGKSTLLRLIIGLIPPLAGELLVFGAPPRRGNPQIGYVPQARHIDSDLALRGIDLVGLGLDGIHWGFARPGAASRRKRERVMTAIEQVGAEPYAGRRIGALSGGERQRLLLAQALVSAPALLLLDEPLASLDLRNQALMVELIARVARTHDLTVVLVAHDLNPLRGHIDKVCYLAGGKVAVGPPDDIVSAPVLSRLYGAPVEVLVDSRGRRFVAGLDEEAAHPHVHAGSGARV